LAWLWRLLLGQLRWENVHAIVVHTYGFLLKLVNGQPRLHPETEKRLRRAAEIYHQTHKPIFLPQAWGRVEGRWFWMPEYEKNYLVGLRVSPWTIILPEKQPQGTKIGGTLGELRTTLVTCGRAQWTNVVFISSPLHLLRIRFLVRWLGRKIGWKVEFQPISARSTFSLPRQLAQEVAAWSLMPLLLLGDRGERGYTAIQEYLAGRVAGG